MHLRLGPEFRWPAAGVVINPPQSRTKQGSGAKGERKEMRFVVVSSLLGFVVALAGLTLFGMTWTTALLIWLLSSPGGAILALLSTLTPPANKTKAPMAASVQRQAA
jgi:hypothetical protein